MYEKTLVDFSIVLLKFILVPCVHRCYIQNHAQSSFFCEPLSMNLCPWCYQPIINPHDDKGEKQDSAASLVSCLAYVGNSIYF